MTTIGMFVQQIAIVLAVGLGLAVWGLSFWLCYQWLGGVGIFVAFFVGGSISFAIGALMMVPIIGLGVLITKIGTDE